MRYSFRIGDILESGLPISGGTLTGTVTFSTPAGIKMYNTADETTNFELGELKWNGNNFELSTSKGGTGTARSIKLVASGGTGVSMGANEASWTTDSGATAMHHYTQTDGVALKLSGRITSQTSRAVIQLDNAAGGPDFSASSGTQLGVQFTSSVNQSSSAGYTAVLVNMTETSTGSGTKRLLDLQTGSTTRFNVDNTGIIHSAPLAVTAGTMTVTNSAQLRTVIHRFDWTNAMVVALGASTTGDIAVCTLPAKTVVTNAYIVINTPDTSSNALTVSLGRTGATYLDYIGNSDAKAAANTVYGDASGERGANLTGYDLPSFTGTTVVNAHFIKTTTNLSTVTGSTGTVYLETYTLP